MNWNVFRLPPKQELANKLINYPTLNSILCLLLYERLFRWAFAAGLLFVPLLLAFVLKVWTVTPSGFTPVVKLSGLDFVQAWALKRTALKETEAGRYDDAFSSWQMAVANNPADAELLHGLLRHMLEGNPTSQSASQAVNYTRWLLRLRETNMVDLELSARVYDKFDLPEWTLLTLQPKENELTPFLEGKLLKALFQRDQMSRFQELWEQMDPSRVIEPDLFLYHAAYQAGWGSLAEAGEARRKLDQAMDHPETRMLAHRLNLKVSERLVQPERYRDSLSVLTDWRQDKLQDHVRYWELLASIGRKPEAARLLKAHVAPPGDGEEAVLLAKAYFDLEMPDESREILRRYAMQFVNSSPVWFSYSNLLMVMERWDDLFGVALQLRHELNPLRDLLEGYSFYLQGVAEHGRGRKERAEEAFLRIKQVQLRNTFWELVAAEKIGRLGYPGPAQKLLLSVQEEVEANPEYWFLLARTAYDQRDPELLVSALSSAYKLRSDDFAIVNNYAAALLVTRQRPEEAMELTGRLLVQSPRMAGSRLNHAMALLQNSKPDEAEVLLQTLAPERLSGPDRAAFHQNAFELRMLQGRYEEALKHLGQLEMEYLLPPERQWIEKMRNEIPSGITGAPAASEAPSPASG